MDDAEVSAEELVSYRMLLFRASHAQKQLMHPYMAAIGLGTGQPKLLSYLAEHGSCAPRELADYYELDPAGVSRMLDALTRKGFVSIAPHAGDRRSKVVSLTAEGERVACAWNAACAEEAAAMLAGFSYEERTAFADYLRRAHANLRAYGKQLTLSAAEAQIQAASADAAASGDQAVAGELVDVAGAGASDDPAVPAGNDATPSDFQTTPAEEVLSHA